MKNYENPIMEVIKYSLSDLLMTDSGAGGDALNNKITNAVSEYKDSDSETGLG